MAVCSASVDDGARNPFRASTARRDQLRLAAEVIARSRCVSVLSRSHQPVGDCRGTPSPNAKLVLVAFRTRLIAMKNIRSRSASGGDMDPYSSAAHDQCKIGSLLSNASTKGLSRGSVCRRGSAERKSESRAVVAERKDTCRWRARALARAKLDFTSSRRSVDSTSTNRQGWQYPTEGARLARSSSECIKAASTRSRRKRRTSRRQRMRSRNDCRNSRSNCRGDGSGVSVMRPLRR